MSPSASGLNLTLATWLPYHKLPRQPIVATAHLCPTNLHVSVLGHQLCTQPLLRCRVLARLAGCGAGLSLRHLEVVCQLRKLLAQGGNARLIEVQLLMRFGPPKEVAGSKHRLGCRWKKNRHCRSARTAQSHGQRQAGDALLQLGTPGCTERERHGRKSL